MLKGFKYRLYPNKEQSDKIDRTIGVCRFIYNLALETKIYAYKSHGVVLSEYDLKKQLPDLRKEYSWIKEVDSQSIAAEVLKLGKSFRAFFRGSGYPKFKKKRNKGTFQCPCNKREIDFDKGLLSVPKIENIPIRISKKFEGEIKCVTISRTNTNKYFASILVDTNTNEKSVPNKDKGVGIDLGITTFATLSNGEKIHNPKRLVEQLDRLRIFERRVNRKRKGSKNRQKCRIKLNLLHERIVNQRKDFLHKVSTKLIRDNQTDTICVETLAVSNMVKNHKLAQSISDAGWAEFILKLEYKGKWYGKNLVKVGRFFASSKICSNCNHKLDELPLSVREWTCPNCGEHHDRDVNAAINIRNSGMGSPGGPVELRRIRRAKKQESMPRTRLDSLFDS